MDFFTKNRFWGGFALIMLILNGCLLFMLWFRPEMRPPHVSSSGTPRSAEAFLKGELNMTDEQMRKYYRLTRTHHLAISSYRKELHTLKRQMMDRIFIGDADSLAITETAQRIGRLQSKIDEATFHHFLELKALIGPEQADALRKLVGEFFRQTLPHDQRNWPKPPNNLNLPPKVNGPPRR